MNENIYGGRTIPSSPFVFDKIYSSYAAATAAAASDNIMYGRYVLIQYCDTLFDYTKRVELENLTTVPSGTIDEKKYYNNFVVDGRISYDRVVLQKINNGVESYRSICCLHPVNAGAYSDRITLAVDTIENLNISNGSGTASVQTQDSRATGNNTFAAAKGKALGELSVAFGQGSQTNSNSSNAFGFNVQSSYPYETVIGKYNQIPYIDTDLSTIGETAILHPVLEIGCGDTIESKHSNLIVDSNNSIIHTYYEKNSPYKIQLLRGWKAKSVRTILGSPSHTVDKIIITTDSVQGLYDGEGTDQSPYIIKYNNCFVWDKWGIVSSSDCHIETIDVVGNTITIKFDAIKTTTEVGNVQGIFVPAAIDTAPDALFGANAIMSGKNKYYGLGDMSYAFGDEVEAFGNLSFATGYRTKAYGHCAFSTGSLTKAFGPYSVGEGSKTSALGAYSHAAGIESEAEGAGAFSVGYKTNAKGAYSFAAGEGTIVNKGAGFVVGSYNDSAEDVFTVGIGTSDSSRYDGLVVKTSGLVLAPCATKEKIKNDGDNYALVTKEYVENELNKYVDYIKEQGVAIGTMSYDASTGTASTDSTKNLSIRYFPIYWEKWASGKSRCYFTASFKPQSYSQGGAGGDANPTWDRCVSCQCTLDPILYSPESDLKTLGLSNIELFKEGRFPAVISLFGDQAWAFLAPYDNSPANKPGDNANDLSQYAIGEALVANSATYIVCPTFWLKEQYASLWYQIKTGFRTFYCEIQGFWKHPLKQEQEE